MMSVEFTEACKKEIVRLEQRANHIGTMMVEAGGEAREWALEHHPAEYYRNRIARGELMEAKS